MSASVALWALFAGVTAGVASLPHCAGMCGPLAAFACRAPSGEGSSLRRMVAYQGGRLVAYTALGAGAGALGHGLSFALPGRYVQALLSWSLALALGFAAVRAYRASRPPRARSAEAPIALGRAPRPPSLAERLLGSVLHAPLLLGLLTALLPCGALASGLLVAAGTAHPLTGGLAMAGFAVGSGPALALAAWAVAQVRMLAGPVGLRLAAVALALGAVVLVVRPIAGLRSDEPVACHPSR
jgi:sulfite exporter TauE/SafE